MGLGTASKLLDLDAATDAIMQSIIAPQVGRPDLAAAVGYVTNAGAPTSVTPDFKGQRLLDTTNDDWYFAYGVASGEWSLLSTSGLSAAELNVLDGVTAGTGAASKAVVLDANGGATIPGELALDGNTLATQAGAGITGGTGTVYKSGVVKVGGIITTSILIDLTGLGTSTTDLDIIGQGASAAHLGQITAARTGTILSGTMTCLELPATGADDIDLYSAAEATGVFDAGIGTLTETALLTRGAAWAAGDIKHLTALPAANEYLYLTNGEAAVVGTYTAGKFLLELQGYDA